MKVRACPQSLPQDKQLIHRVLAAFYGKPCRRSLVCLMEITDVSEFDLGAEN